MAQEVTDATAELRGGPRAGAPLPPAPLLGFVIAVAAVAFISLLTYRSHQTRAVAASRVTHTLATVDQLQSILSLIKDAETGQRGFLLTGEESYLEPNITAKAQLPGVLKKARELLVDNPRQEDRLSGLDQIVKEKLAELDQAAALRRKGDVMGALAMVRTDRGKVLMDRIRSVISTLEVAERASLATREEEWRQAESISASVTFGGSAVLLVLIVAAGFLTSRDYRARQVQGWLRAGQMALGQRIQGGQRLERLADSVLDFLASYLGARVGCLYVAEGPGVFRRLAGYAVDPEAKVVHTGEGLLGQAAKENRPVRVSTVPEGYLPITSGLGRGQPRELLVCPAATDGTVQAVVELGFFRTLQPEDLELMGRLTDSLGVAIRASKDRSRLEELLEETQRQGEELQTQQEELRVSNEGLERQRDELAAAQTVLAAKAADLERANQYKSEFLANMSHELRTPLNSSLILAKILADNRNGNLTPEQVKYAQTISSAGNDLLAIINDILDLSKIEAGKVELSPQPVAISRILDELAATFQMLAQSKKLHYSAAIAPNAPAQLDTDIQRLGQILRNLISNALKFTDTGGVSIRVERGAGETLRFAVQDTGIGISQHQQEIIFDAFRQADGSTHRKYGGTGLGLTISRDLARLLGGDISVYSEPGKGSTFTLTLPLVYRAGSLSQVKPATAAVPAPIPFPQRAPLPNRIPLQQVEDDSDRLKPDSRLILIVEDDAPFATILRDLAHESSFQCIVAHTANDALAAVATYRPKAILLDMNLPDYSGLGLLDQLKRNPLHRHIPVHVVSVADYSHEARAMGAIGYAMKPVNREQLIEALQRLEAKLSQDVRNVLVVEDDERQRESICHLLENEDVRITAVRDAADALAQLRKSTFDCMVMDLNLPDFSGYELLKRMSEADEVSFPPVIVYTGRSLTSDEEQKLRRFSKSIIIKDARSPERLLDEVTLFLHQVEAKLPAERQRMLQIARDRDAALEGRRILVVEDDVRNIFALSSLLEPKGATVEIARNGREAVEVLTRSSAPDAQRIDLILMDIMMPEMDGLTAMREIRRRPEWKKLPVIALTAKAMKDDQERCLSAGASDYIAKPLDIEKLMSLIRVWLPKH